MALARLDHVAAESYSVVANSGSKVNSLLPAIVVALRSALILLALTSISFQDGAPTDGPKRAESGEPEASRVSSAAPKETDALHPSLSIEGDERLAVDSASSVTGTIGEIEVVGTRRPVAVLDPGRPGIVRRPLWLFGRSARGPPNARS